MIAADVDDVVNGVAFEFPTLHLELELAILALNRTGLPLDFFPSDPGLHMSISSLSLAQFVVENYICH